MPILICDNTSCEKGHFQIYRNKVKFGIDNIHNPRQYVFCSQICRESWIQLVQGDKKFAMNLKNEFEINATDPNLIPVKGRFRVGKLWREKKKKMLTKLHF